MAWSPNERRPHTRRQRAEKAIVLERARGRCQLRGPHCTGLATIDDHIVPFAEGGTNDLDNRQAACETCHAAKTAQESARGRRRAAARGKRPPRKHPGLL